MNKTIWMLWNQGWNNIPDICQKCLDSWLYHNPDWNIILLDLDNIKDYVDLEEELPGAYSISDKFPAAFSDIVRLSLLKKYGGAWVDATVFCNSSLNDWALDVVDDAWLYYRKDRYIGSWFILAEENSYIINKWYNKVIDYWSQRLSGNDRLNGEYLWVHKLFGECVETDSKFSSIFHRWKKINAICGPGHPYSKTHCMGPSYFAPFKYHLNEPLTTESQARIDSRQDYMYKLSHKITPNNNPNTTIQYLFDTIMDKNKALFKLEGFPSVYYINLDDHTDRREYMEGQFDYWGIKNYTRISAHDGRGDNDLGDILKGKYPNLMTSGEVGCVTSHLKAMKTWLENSDEDEEYLIVMEDDCDLSVVSHWGFTWREFKRALPYHWDVIQLAVINPIEVHIKIHHRFVNDFSTAAYLVRRDHARKLVRMHCRGEFYKLDQNVKPRAVADDLIYNSGLTLAIPLFLYKIALGSSIHDVHVNVFHKSSHDGLWKFWKEQAPRIEDWSQFFDCDAYYGNLPPSLIIKQELAKMQQAQNKPA